MHQSSTTTTTCGRERDALEAYCKAGLAAAGLHYTIIEQPPRLGNCLFTHVGVRKANVMAFVRNVFLPLPDMEYGPGPVSVLIQENEALAGYEITFYFTYKGKP